MISMASRQSPAFTRRMAALKRIVAEGHDIVSRAIGEKTVAVVRARTLEGRDMTGRGSRPTPWTMPSRGKPRGSQRLPTSPSPESSCGLCGGSGTAP